jgi:ribose/xylose/arabinose/galactoside ABC-type transport system permease subunit
LRPGITVPLNRGVFVRMVQSVRRRIAFLLGANALLLGLIWISLKPGSSFAEVLLRTPADIAPVTLAAFALTGIIFTGAIDLSIASMTALAGTIFGALVTHGYGPAVSFSACLCVAWALMALNGFVISRSGMPAIIVTLAGLPLYRGIALILADMVVPNFSGNISVQQEAYHLPGKSYAPVILLLGIVAVLLSENFARHPRLWLALGNSAEACNLVGVDPRRVLNSAFWISGLLFGLSALVYVTRVQAVEPARMALGFELQVIAAVILGGTNIFGGEGSYLGSLLGALFLYLISQLLIYAGASAYLQDALSGAIILLIIGIDCALHRRAKLMEELT